MPDRSKSKTPCQALREHFTDSLVLPPLAVLSTAASTSRPPAASTSALTGPGRKRKGGPTSDEEAEADARKEARRMQSLNGGIPVDWQLLVRPEDTPAPEEGTGAKAREKAQRATKE